MTQIANTITDRLAEALRDMCQITEISFNLGFDRPDQDGPYPTAMKVLAEYDRTPSPASPTRSDTREQAAASPSAVGEGHQWLWRIFNMGWPIGHEDSTNEWGPWQLISGADARRLAADDDRKAYEFVPFAPTDPISSQAPKPASAGGVRVVSQAVLQAAYEHIPTCQGGHTSEFVSGWSSCLEYLARAIAAEADTAKDGAK